MTGWLVLLPFKAAGGRKTRLAGRLSPDERAVLAERLFVHVAGVAARWAGAGHVVLLSGLPRPGWPGRWIADEGRGLNPELASARAALGHVPLIVLHADLPLIGVDDLAALADAAAGGVAIAADRHGGGTNALALAGPTPFAFRFGPDSFRLHAQEAGGALHMVDRPGLALDIDLPEDLDLAVARGFVP